MVICTARPRPYDFGRDRPKRAFASPKTQESPRRFVEYYFRICKNKNVELITSHINADFDAFASMLGAKKLYPDAVLAFPGSQEKTLRDFIDSFHPAPLKRVKDVDLSAITRVIVVDTKSPDRIGPFAELLLKPEVDVHVYDHHRHEEGDIHGSVEVIDRVGAAATLFTEMLRDRGLKPSPVEATAYCLGIYEETGNLLFPSTTERDLQAVSYLLKCGASLNIVATYLKPYLSADEVDLLNELSRSSRELVAGGLRVVVAKASPAKYLGDAARLAHRLMDMEYTDAAVIMLSMEGKVLIVGRSRAPELNIAEVMEEFGGGGHPMAASATVREMPLEILEEKLVAALMAKIRPGRFALDVMTTPVITIEADSTVGEAESMMTRYGINVLPVVHDGAYRGIISREVVEKAIFHGFRDGAAIDFATSDAAVAEKYLPIRDVESQMIERNQRFMPVVEGERIIGAITRTDLLRDMYEEHLRRSMVKEAVTEEKSPVRKNLASWLRNRFPPDVHNLLRAAGETAEGLNFGAYLVGGSVRDLLRGEENLDMDIVVEGGGIEFAKRFGARLGAKVHTHERFGTATLVAGKRKLDITTARTEYYESPAALPKVEMSSIKKDLYRRDFTINTLAIKLNPADFGKLVDFFGGQRDIKEKTIRVLHNLSFVEDPTRAFRALRFAERFGFRLSRHTENLIKSAVKMSLFDRLSGSRLYEELLLTFDEKEPVAVVRRLAEFGLLGVIHPALELTERLEGLLGAVQQTLFWFGMLFTEEKPQRAFIHLMALLAELKEVDKIDAMTRLSVPMRTQRSVVEDYRAARETLRRLPLMDPAAIHEELSRLRLETLLFCMALAEDEEKKKELSLYLLELRKARPALTGEDLKGMGIEPGPVYSRLLKELLHGRLRGRLRSREDEERQVKKLLKSMKEPSRRIGGTPAR